VAGDSDLFDRAHEAAAAAAKAEAEAAARLAKAQAAVKRQARKQLRQAAIRDSRQILQLNYDPKWRVVDRIASEPTRAEAVIRGLRWWYDDRGVLMVFHPNPQCGHDRTAVVSDLVKLGQLFSKDGKPNEAAWEACSSCHPSSIYGDIGPPW
jgi:hypothetical protein